VSNPRTLPFPGRLIPLVSCSSQFPSFFIFLFFFFRRPCGATDCEKSKPDVKKRARMRWASTRACRDISWASGALDPEGAASHSSATSIKRGVWAMIAVFLAYCTLQAPSTILIRPHPAFWRLVHGLAVVYLVALTFLLFQNRDDARRFMKHLSPDLGVELPERSYGADCRLYVPENPKNKFINIYETLFDEFVVAHVLGWWGKAVMIRNQALLWVLSIGFELMELTFRHMLPNFNECWWDSIILDILICNWFGYLGGNAHGPILRWQNI
uniref:CDP-diacylglycerol--serine O-phosphatidyltransferase n=1 Tax=Aegilops tauschii subsp. strangulata TaxID=200361 RepID=A0A452ZU49_AEGTS